ncbi:aquaporin-11 [Frankliniella occidentalis]|uniref:Aquaporin n=1 Tax=Frankliniella occidentalis TaxID=133901 RepID=A0A6J1T4L2_FRAOC|nr:aquaporin-11 [Frankliniella occidentalis]
MADMSCLSVSLFIIVLTCFLASVARRVAVRRTRGRPLVRGLFLEGIATAELCGCCFELIIVADNFGVLAYAGVLFVLTVWWSNEWGDATACPYTHLEDVLDGKADVREAALKIWAQLTGGVLIFRYIQLLWWLELCDTHKNRAFEACTADLQVPVMAGAIIEGVATMLCRLASRTIADLQPKFSSIIESFIGTSLVVLAFNFSGGYFNPALATALKLGCKGHTTYEHLIVYWAGACAGAVAGTVLYKVPAVKRRLLGEDKARKLL